MITDKTIKISKGTYEMLKRMKRTTKKPMKYIVHECVFSLISGEGKNAPSK